MRTIRTPSSLSLSLFVVLLCSLALFLHFQYGSSLKISSSLPQEQEDEDEEIVKRLGVINTPEWNAHKTTSTTSSYYNCTTCNNGEACCGGEVCCGNGDSCCPAGSGCCGGECCQNSTQSCCPDPAHGGICCESDTTYCCPPEGEIESRCCPRWNVCCKLGRYGCCDPGTGLPLEEDDLFFTSLSNTTSKVEAKVSSFFSLLVSRIPSFPSFLLFPRLTFTL
jgi:hypothetical protein